MFAINARVHGLSPVEVPLDARFALDTEAMLRAIAEHRPNLVFLATPNNPTGNAFDDDAIESIVRAAPDALVVIDEAYAAFAGRSLGSSCDRHDNVAVLGTLSKVGLAAARVGWARLHPALAAEVDKVRQPYNLNRLSETGAALALTEIAPVLDAQIADIVRARDALGTALAAVPGLTVHPSRANFFLVRVDGDAAAFAARLAARGVGVRAFGDPLLSGCVRITVGTPDENAALLRALDDAG
jgi:histidinol-phosphate aminotransferase